MPEGATSGRLRRSEPYELAAVFGLGLIVLCSVQILGAQPPAVLLGVAFASISLGAYLASRRQLRVWVPPTSLWLAALGLWSLVQIVPMPVSFLGLVAPHNAEVWQRALEPVGGTVEWAPISLDPSATARESVKWMTYALLLGCSAILAAQHAARHVIALVACSSGLLSVVTVAHALFGATRLFGLYEPVYAYPRGSLSPLLNPNHLASYLVLGALCAAGLAVSPRTRSLRWVFVAVAVIDFGVIVRTASRGGVLALLLGLMATSAMISVRGRGPRADRADTESNALPMAVLALIVVAGVGLALTGLDAGRRAELLDSNPQKLLAMTAYLPMLRHYASTGVGRGAFESVFDAYREEAGGNTTYTHPESWPAQWLVEWGVIGMVAAVAITWTLRPLLRLARRDLAWAGATAGVLAMAVHNLLDFSLELFGVGIAFSVVLGALLGASTRLEREEPPAVRGRATLAGLVAALLIATGVASVAGGEQLGADRRALKAHFDAWASREQGTASPTDRIARGLRRYPADYYHPMMGAMLAIREGGNPEPWLRRALERGPTVSRVHLTLAQVLQARGATSQALFHCRLAAQFDPVLGDVIASRVLAWSKSSEQVLSAVPEGSSGGDLLEILARQAIASDRFELAIELDRASLERGERVGARRRLAEGLLRRLERDECEDPTECELEITAHALQLVTRDPSSSAGEQALARTALVTGGSLEARERLREGCKKPKDLEACLRLLATVEEDAQVPKVVARYVQLLCARPGQCAEALDWSSAFHADRGELALALVSAQRAARQQSSPVRWRLVAELASRVRNQVALDEALERLAGEPAHRP